MKPHLTLHSTEDIPWTPIAATASSVRGKGITEKILSIDPDNPHNCTRLVKLEKGVRTGVVLNPFWEEVWIVKGILIDEGNRVTGKEGYYCCRHPGMSHGPFYIPAECITFEIHYIPKEGWDGKPQSDLHSTSDIPWTPIRATVSSHKGEGLTEKILNVDPDNPHNCTRLFRAEKDVKLDESITHTFWEEELILKGTVLDEHNQVIGKEGYYACIPPDTSHGPTGYPEETIGSEFRYMPKGVASVKRGK